jgi:hypothetical protein
MATIGTTFEQKYPWHSQLAAKSPLVIQITGEKQFRPTEAPTFFFRVQGDPEGEYGMKPAGKDDIVRAYYAAMVRAPQQRWLKMTAAGREKDKKDDQGKIVEKGNACTIRFEAVDVAETVQDAAQGEVSMPWMDQTAESAEEAPAPQQSNGPAPVHNYPYATMMEAYTEALRASYTILSMDGLPLGPDDTESLRAIAATLMIGQKEIHREVGLWIPIR